MHNKALKQALSATLPTFFAYFPLGIVFGVLSTHEGYPWFFAPIMSAVVYAGAMQFVALSMMSEHATLLAIFFATLFVGLRNSFYGLSVMDRFRPAKPLLKFFLIFGLVDSAYAIFVTTDKKENDLAFCFYVTLFLYLYWLTGSFIGAAFADSIPNVKGLDFVLTSFFALLVIEYFMVNRKLDALVLPVLFASSAYLVFPNQYLIIAILLCSCYLYLKTKVTTHA